MPSVKRTRKLILTALYDLYLFPQSDRAIASALRSIEKEIASDENVKDCLIYLEKKGLVTLQKGISNKVTARISASGVDIVEGASKDRGILSANPSLTGLATRRASRRFILSYCRQFPESFNGDDEIHAEFAERGLPHILIDQLRFHLWYLSGKNVVELKTQPVAGDVVYLARITAAGIDLLDGAISDPGVASHG